MLTDSQIKSLKIEDGKRHADRDGLVLELRPSKKKLNKVFIFRFQWNKKPQTITIGNYLSIGLAEARNIALTYRDMLNKGIDPRSNDSDSEQARITFEVVADQWFQKYKGTWKDFARNRHSKSLSRDILPLIGNKPIDEITKADLLNIIKPHEDLRHHDVAHRLYARLQATFEFAMGASLTTNYPFVGLKKALIPKPKATNQPAISSVEAHEMMAALKNNNCSKIIKLYTEILAHVFTRPSELREAKWCEFDLQNAEWNIPAERMKMGVPHWVPLTPHVLSLLKELRLITGFTPYLFSSPALKKSQPISETSVRKLLHNAGYKNRHTAHGFRSLASSVLHEQSNFRTDAIEAQLAHKVQGVRGVYLRADFKQERKQLMDWYSNWLLEKENVNHSSICL
ncbi:tyrosine-type recombinase/integrase [Legionella tucsonensis]|uniref:Integrase n=1 Tax=Legionella tucsonensis TaxID=40335 RepID=A0A0W0ZXR5_9GAMM|nr:integrase arm-type DNA-binding domain-containing protein [Legionella tucsonensis]KTD73922.1 integrase [Legionella tucsonensis]